MKTGQLVSIIVPVCNVEIYIEKCIRSIMGQTYPWLEIIVVDDGSTDNSGSICDKLAEEDFRIKVIHQCNGGLVRARKRGLDVAEGEFIGFVDGDDYIDAEMYEKLYQYLIESKADFVHTGFVNDDKRIMKGVRKGGDINVTEENRINLIKDVIFGFDSTYLITPSIWSKLFRRDILLKSYGMVEDDSSYGEDLICLCNCFMTCNRVLVVPEAYYHYTTRETSLSRDKASIMIERINHLYNVLHEIFVKNRIWDSLRIYVNDYYLYILMDYLSKKSNHLKRNIQLYQFPDIEQMFGKKIVLYGAGAVGYDYYAQIKKYVKCELVAWTDSRYMEYECEYCELIDPQMILELVYDVVIIGVMAEGAAEEIKQLLVHLGVSEDKICWKLPERIRI